MCKNYTEYVRTTRQYLNAARDGQKAEQLCTNTLLKSYRSVPHAVKKKKVRVMLYQFSAYYSSHFIHTMQLNMNFADYILPH